MLRKWLFGDDIFISYPREDSTPYALNLATRLQDCGYKCFLDQFGTSPGEQIPAKVLWRVPASTMFVLVASEAACQSLAIRVELESFDRTKKDLIVIDRCGQVENAVWYDLVKGLPFTADLTDEQTCSSHVIERIVRSFKYTVKNQRLLQSAVSIVLAVSCLLTGAGFIAWQLRDQVDSMQSNVASVGKQVGGIQSNVDLVGGKVGELESNVGDAKLLSKLPFYRLPGDYSEEDLRLLDEQINHNEDRMRHFERTDGKRFRYWIAKLSFLPLDAERAWAKGEPESSLEKLRFWEQEAGFHANWTDQEIKKNSPDQLSAERMLDDAARHVRRATVARQLVETYLQSTEERRKVASKKNNAVN